MATISDVNGDERQQRIAELKRKMQENASRVKAEQAAKEASGEKPAKTAAVAEAPVAATVAQPVAASAPAATVVAEPVSACNGAAATAPQAAPVTSVNQPKHNHSGTVGRLLTGMEVMFEPVPGIEKGGRMLVRGPNVMEGYLSPSKPGELQKLPSGWHDTGDIVVQDDEGYLTIKGRLKRFAKIGGEMVSLAVVENCASTLWREHEHAAAVLPDKRKGEQIVLLTTFPKADRSELQRWAQDHGVNELSLPRKIFQVKAIPVLGTGKMDIGGVQKLAAEIAARNETGGIQAAE